MVAIYTGILILVLLGFSVVKYLWSRTEKQTLKSRGGNSSAPKEPQ
jgi:hypothetical protein